MGANAPETFIMSSHSMAQRLSETEQAPKLMCSWLLHFSPPQMMFLWQRAAVWALLERKSNAVSRLHTPWKNGVQPRGLFPRIQLSIWTLSSPAVVVSAAVRPILLLVLTEQEELASPKSIIQNPAWLSFWLEAEPRRPQPPSLMGWPVSKVVVWLKAFLSYQSGVIYHFFVFLLFCREKCRLPLHSSASPN